VTAYLFPDQGGLVCARSAFGFHLLDAPHRRLENPRFSPAARRPATTAEKAMANMGAAQAGKRTRRRKAKIID
jgi:hypothetical protein